MKRSPLIVVLVCSSWFRVMGQGQSLPAQAPTPTPSAATISSPVAPEDESARKARGLIAQAIEALGGPAYLGIRDREQTGRSYTLHHGQQTSNGLLFWSFTEFPDKERFELTKERDVAELYVGNKGWEITYKGAHPSDPKDLVEYQRQHYYSLDAVLRTWVNDPGVIYLFEGNAIAAQHEAFKVTLINTKDESVTLFIDTDTHLPVKKTFTWRDPVDRQLNLEEEVYDNYKPVSGVMAPFNVTRYFNGDMSRQRFIFSVTFNQGLDQAMFDPNSGYDPNKPVKKR